MDQCVEDFFKLLLPGQISSALFQVLPEVLFWVKDGEGRFMMVNAAFAEMLELEVGEIVGKTDEDVYPASMARVFVADDARVLEKGEAIWNKLEIVTRRMGGVEWKMTSKIPLKDAAGAVVGTAGICRKMEGLRGGGGVEKSLPKEYQDLVTLVEYVEAHVEENLTIHGVAKTLGVSVATLERRFMAHFGTTPKRYFLQARMSVACERLLHTVMSVGEVADSLGYKEHAAFTRAFSSVVHLSPREYRKYYRQ